MSEDLPPQAPVAVNVGDHNIKGDWVLFHPVYTHDELRSVEVCVRIDYVQHTLLIREHRCCIGRLRRSPIKSLIRSFTSPGWYMFVRHSTLTELLTPSPRWGFDLVSGYKHKPLPPNADKMSLQELQDGGYLMNEAQWLKVSKFE